MGPLWTSVWLRPLELVAAHLTVRFQRNLTQNIALLVNMKVPPLVNLTQDMKHSLDLLEFTTTTLTLNQKDVLLELMMRGLVEQKKKKE